MAAKSRKYVQAIFWVLLTSDGGIDGQYVGKINLFAMRAYVAVHKSVAKKALKKMESGKMKGRQFRARLLK